MPAAFRFISSPVNLRALIEAGLDDLATIAG